MSNFSKLVEEEKIKSRIDSIKQIRNDINRNDKDIQNKIKNFIIRFDNIFSYDDIVNKILTDDIVAACFAKDPVKQNISEKLCSDYIKVPLAPQSGKNCIRFNDKGDIVALKKDGGCKSVDFILPEGIYATQKYTGNYSGGAQDNQFNDVILFLQNGSIKHKVAAIVDGWYWEENGKKNELIELFKENNNVFIFSADDYKEGKIKFVN